MQNIKIENSENGIYRSTPEKRAQNRENQLLSFVIKATARDQEKNALISKLQREKLDAEEDFQALQTEMKLKDKMLNTKEEELLTMKSENEALKLQLNLLLENNKSEANGFQMLVDKVSELDNNLKKSNSNASESSKSPSPAISRKRSIKKSKDVTNLFYNLRKKSKK